ncbi:MAG: hypothetical protein JSW50_08830, partial [Candidatus Latescibacterota bacterium]
MRWLIFSLSFLFGLDSSFGQVLLNEIYYDHHGRDEGYEFVELINCSNRSQPLDDLRLEFHDGASVGWVTIWEGQPGERVEESGGLFVIGGDSIGSFCDVIKQLGLQNGPDALRLVGTVGVLDLVGYGDLDDPQYYEAASAPDVPAGLSLARVPDGTDTDVNAADFMVVEPSPGRFNVPRDDVLIRLAMGTPARFVWPHATTENVAIRLFNNGLRSIPRYAAVVQIGDSTRQGVRVLGSIANEFDIASGDSVDVTSDVFLGHGYHVVSAVVTYPPDERSDNNRLVLVRR